MSNVISPTGNAVAKALLDNLISEPNFSMIVTKKMWQQTRQRVYGSRNDNLTDFLDAYEHIFSYSEDLDIHDHRKITVNVDPSLRVCVAHVRPRGSCTTYNCDDLHCCKFYISGQCKFGENCKFGHNLSTPHNYRLLVAYCLENIQPPKLGEILKLAESESDDSTPRIRPPAVSDFSAKPNSVCSSVPVVPAPDVQNCAPDVPKCCSFYNSNKGCRHGDSEKCKKVHICKHYMMGDCKFGGRECKYSHDLHNPQAKAVLSKFGINSDKERVSDILEKMRSGAQEKGDDAVSRASSSSEVSHSGGSGTRKSREAWTDTEVSSQGLSRGHRDNSQDSNLSTEDKEVYSEICIFNLRDKCNYGNSCKRYHTSLKVPYHWQHKGPGSGGRWIDFANQCQFEIEQCFCDPGKDECFAQDNGRFQINFKEMTYSVKPEQRGRGRAQTGEVRRLCTKSSVGMSELNQYTTLWRWYWVEDDGRWIEFGYTKHGTKVHGSLSSRDIEEEFTSDPVANISFSRGRFAYELHLGTMCQVNMGTRKERSIKRRPAPFDASTKQPMKHGATVKSLMEIPMSPSDVAASVPSLMTGSSADAFHAGKTMYPTHWTSIPSASCDSFQLITIQPNGATAKEYADLSQLFKLTLPEMRLKSIRRIQNIELWDAFYRKKSWMEKKLQSANATKAANEEGAREPRGGENREGGRRRRAVSAGRCGKGGGELSVFSPSTASTLNVQRLFHGTKKSIIDAICQQGFDWRLNGTSVGTIYGKGSYFAKQASYSAAYTDCRTLFVAQVLVGAYAQGLPAYVRPPPKNPNKPLLDLYDSCVDNMVEPNIFVVFAQEQAYPEYLIEY